MTLVQRLTSIAYDYQDGDPKAKARQAGREDDPRQSSRRLFCLVSAPPRCDPRSCGRPTRPLAQRRTPHAEECQLATCPGPIEYLVRPSSPPFPRPARSSPPALTSAARP